MFLRTQCCWYLSYSKIYAIVWLMFVLLKLLMIWEGLKKNMNC